MMYYIKYLCNDEQHYNIVVKKVEKKKYKFIKVDDKLTIFIITDNFFNRNYPLICLEKLYKRLNMIFNSNFKMFFLYDKDLFCKEYGDYNNFKEYGSIYFDMYPYDGHLKEAYTKKNYTQQELYQMRYMLDSRSPEQMNFNLIKGIKEENKQMHNFLKLLYELGFEINDVISNGVEKNDVEYYGRCCDFMRVKADEDFILKINNKEILCEVKTKSSLHIPNYQLKKDTINRYKDYSKILLVKGTDCKNPKFTILSTSFVKKFPLVSTERGDSVNKLEYQMEREDVPDWFWFDDINNKLKQFIEKKLFN